MYSVTKNQLSLLSTTSSKYIQNINFSDILHVNCNFDQACFIIVLYHYINMALNLDTVKSYSKEKQRRNYPSVVTPK